MLMSKLVGERTKTTPADAVIKSHVLMLRAGYIKSVANGIWSLATPAKRIALKIERIIREEMDAVEGQECSFPVVMPRELWEESGRYSSIGDEMVRFKDRNLRDLVLGMTHEEAAVQFARDAVNSYQQLPFMIYQFQTKFRDEARARGGLIRVREFTMKDAYSFHISQEDLEAYYARVYDAYTRIFNRIGMKNVVAVKSDTGMMGGSVAHEYMLLTDIGEDTLALCDNCGYKANMEVAAGKRPEVSFGVERETMREIYTGKAAEIAELEALLGIKAYQMIKAVVFAVKGGSGVVVVFIRGDLEVNEAKLKKTVLKNVVPWDGSTGEGLVAGNIGPVGLKVDTETTVVFDKSLEGAYNMVCGANKADYHIAGVECGRDFSPAEFADVAKVKAGDFCPVCGKPLRLNNGIEVGNIFQLGTKYTKSMDMTVLNSEGKAVNPIMGCYGIGVGRAIASVAEESADEKGLNWPMAIAPWQVYLCAIRMDDPKVAERAKALYEEMKSSGIEVIFDDRNASPGFKFADCDLMGIPIRVVVSPRTLAAEEAEIQLRDGTIKENTSLTDCVNKLKLIISERINQTAE